MKKYIWLLLFCGSCFIKIYAQNVDIEVLKRIVENRTIKRDETYQKLTNSVPYVAFGSTALQLGVGLINQNKEIRNKGLSSGIALVGTYGVGFLLKRGVDRQRPYEKYPDIAHYKFENDASFPSGSTAIAFSIATSLTSNYPKWYVAVPAYGFATMVGYSRMHLGAHYPSDVLAGAIIGSGSVFITNKLNKWIKR